MAQTRSTVLENNVPRFQCLEVFIVLYVVVYYYSKDSIIPILLGDTKQIGSS